MLLSNSFCSIDDTGFHILDRNYPLVTVKKEIDIDHAVFYSEYVGVYELALGLTISVSCENPRLWARATGDLPYGLYPLSITSFFYRQSGAEISFEGSIDGNVTGLIFHNGGRRVAAKRLE